MKADDLFAPNTPWQPVPSLVLPCDSDPVCDRHKPLLLPTSHRARTLSRGTPLRGAGGIGQFTDGRGDHHRGCARTLLIRSFLQHLMWESREVMATGSIHSPIIIEDEVKSQVHGQLGKYKQFRNQPGNKCNYSKVQERVEGLGLPLGRAPGPWAEGVGREPM